MKKKYNHASWNGESHTPIIYKGNTPLFTIQVEKEVVMHVIRHEKSHYYPKTTTTTMTTKADTVNTYKLVVTYYFYTFTGYISIVGLGKTVHDDSFINFTSRAYCP